MNTQLKQQGGFSILTLLIAAVALFGILSAIVSLSRSGASVSSDSVKPIASAIVTQGNNIATAFQSATARSIADSSVTYGNTVAAPGANDLLNPTNTGLAFQTAPAQAFVTGAAYPYWMYRGNLITVTNVGSAAADYTFVLAGLSLAVCQEINRSLTNAVAITASGLANIAAVVGTGAPTAALPFSLAGAAVIPVGNGLQGCMSTNDNNYFYYIVVEPQ